MRIIWKKLPGLTLLLISSQCISQGGGNEAITVGDILPDIEIKNVINYKTVIINISDFKGKLLILDFWATWCSPCISSFKKIDSLQKQFGDKLQILPVSYEKKDNVAIFLKRMQNVIGLLPATVTEDVELGKLFKHTTLPHYVWIDGNRKVIAISEGEDLTEKNISAVIKGKQPIYTLKNDEEKKLSYNPTAFVTSVRLQNLDSKTNNIGLEQLENSKLIAQTTLTNYIAGYHSGAYFPDSNYFFVRNSSIAQLYKIAMYGNSLMKIANINWMEVEIPDSALYLHVKGVYKSGQRISAGLETDAWLKLNGYCYESKVPPELSKERFNIMLADLNRYFGPKLGIVGEIEKREGKYLALVRTGEKDLLRSSGGEPMHGSDKFFALKIKNEKIFLLLDQLMLSLQDSPPLIDETGYSEPVDIELNCKLSNINDLNKALELYGLELVEKEKMMDVAVIKMKE